MEDEDTGLRVDWHGVQEGKYQNFDLDTEFTQGKTSGNMNVQWSHGAENIGKRAVFELLDTIPFLRMNNIEPAQKQNQTPEMIQHYANKTPNTLLTSYPHTARAV